MNTQLKDLPDPGDSNGCAQDHADTVAEYARREAVERNADAVAMTPCVKSYFGRGYPGEVYGLRRKLAASLEANREAAAYIAELQRNGCERGEVAVPSIITDAIKLAEGR